jgi:hypothetical protein
MVKFCNQICLFNFLFNFLFQNHDIVPSRRLDVVVTSICLITYCCFNAQQHILFHPELKKIKNIGSVENSLPSPCLPYIPVLQKKIYMYFTGDPESNSFYGKSNTKRASCFVCCVLVMVLVQVRVSGIVHFRPRYLLLVPGTCTSWFFFVLVNSTFRIL